MTDPTALDIPMNTSPCTHGCQCDFCREDEPEEVHQPSDKIIILNWTRVSQANGFMIVNGTPNMTFEQLGERGKRRDQINAEAQAAGGDWAAQMLTWTEPAQPPLSESLKAAIAPLERLAAEFKAKATSLPGWYQRATEAHQAAGTALAAGADPIKAMDEYARQAREQNHANAMLQAGQNALPAAQHPSEVQMLTADLNAVTRERDAAIAEMGRLEKERDTQRWLHETYKSQRNDFLKELEDAVSARDGWIEAYQELSRRRDILLMALAAMKRSYMELYAQRVSEPLKPAPGIPLRALGGTHAATGLKMGERG